MNRTGPDIIRQLGELAIATRLKRLAESLQADVGRVYREMDIDFEPKWFTMLYALYHNEKLSVVELASLLKFSHPAIIQFAEQMQKKKLVAFQRDKKDARKKLIQLTDKGKAVYKEIEPILHEIEAANWEFLREAGADVLGLVEKMELQLESKTMYERINEKLTKNFKKEIRITTYDASRKEDFRKLNEEWLKEFFKMEQQDKQLLGNPQKEILDKDGEIFFAEFKDTVIGTCAIKKKAPATYEVLKMAVTNKFQSRGVGKMLMNKAIEFAHKNRARVIELDTSRRLSKAMKLYEGMGFKVTDTMPSPGYERATIRMSLDLSTVMLLFFLSIAATMSWKFLVEATSAIICHFPEFFIENRIRHFFVAIDFWVK